MRLSVVIPGYNTPEVWWLRCINSVRTACADAQIICVDDGSSDGAVFLDDIEGITVIHQSNMGPSSARNAGISAASGDWISFVDSDDEVLPDVFSRCISAASSSGSDIVVCGVEVIWPDDGMMKSDVAENRVLGKLTPFDVRYFADKHLLNYIWNKLYSRSFIERFKIRFPQDAVMGEDLIFNFDCIDAGATWCSVDYVGYRYYRTRSTLLSRYKPFLESGLRHYSEVWRRYKEKNPGAEQTLSRYGVFSETAIADSCWKNAWMPGSPVSLRNRWALRPGMAFLRMAIYMLLRRNLYIKPIRRWKIKRNFPDAREM